jgi:hypothetical protein
MKYLSKFICAAILLAGFAACKKVGDLPSYQNGKATTLTASTTSIAPEPADSNNLALSLSWTFPDYATDSAHMKYVIQIDSAGSDFSKAASRTVSKSLGTTYTAKELNDILLGFGYPFGVPVSMDVRVVSSYANNNEQLMSNVVTISMTPYVVPPKVVPPSTRHLYLVGNATAGGWNNPVPSSSQEFTMIDTLTYEGTFFLNGGGQYVFLPLDGNWDHKFNVADASVPGLADGGSFGFDQGSSNIPGPATTGMYKIFVDFQHGIFTVTHVSDYGLLYVPGDYQGWAPATAPTLGSPNDDGAYEGYVNIPVSASYEFKFASTPDWNNAIGDGGSGTLVPGGGGNLTVPGPGYYHLVANTADNTWSATATTWSVIGSFAASGWSADIPMTYNSGANRWEASITTVDGDQFKFRANNDWGINYGDNDGKGSLVFNGANIGDTGHNPAVPAGNHTIALYLNNSGYYTYSIE